MMILGANAIKVSPESCENEIHTKFNMSSGWAVRCLPLYCVRVSCRRIFDGPLWRLRHHVGLDDFLTFDTASMRCVQNDYDCRSFKI